MIKEFFAKIAGKLLGRELKLKEGVMSDGTSVDSTPWYKSKAKLAMIVGALVAAITPISTAMGHPIVIPNWVLEILGAIGIYGIRDAIPKS